MAQLPDAAEARPFLRILEHQSAFHLQLFEIKQHAL